MPFDGLSSPNLLALEKLDGARELLSDPRRWCKGSLVNEFGQMCTLAALRRVGAEDELKPLILMVARDVTGRTFRSIERFNDHHRTTHATVLQVLDRTRAELVSGRYHAGAPTGYLHRWRSACRRLVTATVLRA
jgi:hypothetical protein